MCAIKSHGKFPIKIYGETKNKFCIWLKDEDEFQVGDTVVKTKLFKKKPRKIFTTAFDNEKSTKKIIFDSTQFQSGWNEPGNEIIYYRPRDVSLFGSNKAVLFDVDGTIIRTKSGNKFPIDQNDWQLWHSSVRKKLNELISNNVRVIFVTNQNGIGSGKTDKDSWIQKMDKLLEKLEIDIEIFVSSGPGAFRKPLPGVFHLLKTYLGLETKNLVMIGDAAGRIARKPHRPKVYKTV